MRKLVLIVGALAAVGLLAWGIFRATRPASVFLTDPQAEAQLEVLGERFSAAIENQRDVAPLLPEVESIVAQRPRLRAGRTLLGQIYARQERTEEAYREFAAALQLDPDDAQLQNLAGTAAQLIGEAGLAETHHRLAAKLVPDEPRLLLPLADVLIEAGRWDEARDVLLAALELQLTLHEAHAGLSDVYAGRGQDGDLVRAIDQLERARAQVRNDPQGREQEITYVRKLARLYARRGEPMEALRALDELMPEQGRYRPEVLAEMAGYLEVNGQLALAGLQYEMAADKNPGNPQLIAEAARWYAKAGNLPRAGTMIERLRPLAPSHPAVRWWDNRAR